MLEKKLVADLEAKVEIIGEGIPEGRTSNKNKWKKGKDAQKHANEFAAERTTRVGRYFWPLTHRNFTTVCGGYFRPPPFGGTTTTTMKMWEGFPSQQLFVSLMLSFSPSLYVIGNLNPFGERKKETSVLNCRKTKVRETHKFNLQEIRELSTKEKTTKK